MQFIAAESFYTFSFITTCFLFVLLFQNLLLKPLKFAADIWLHVVMYKGKGKAVPLQA